MPSTALPAAYYRGLSIALADYPTKALRTGQGITLVSPYGQSTIVGEENEPSFLAGLAAAGVQTVDFLSR